MEGHRVARSDVERWKEAFLQVEERAIWIGVATQAANNHDDFPYRDSEASRWRADAKERAKLAKGNAIKQKRRRARNAAADAGADGGHSLVKSVVGNRNLWRCQICKAWSRNKLKLTRVRCEGSKHVRWEVNGRPAGETSVRQHLLLKTGSVVWCTVCGSFAENKAVRLLSACGGPPIRALGSGGRVAQLARLKSGLHPVTRVRLGETTELDGTKVERSNGYIRLKGVVCSAIDPDFHPYQPEAFPPSICSTIVVGDGKTAKQKADLRECRVKLKVTRSRMRLQEA